MENKISKRMVMKAAWAVIRKGIVKTLSEALKMAWRAFRLKARMAESVVEFAFRKANGEVRRAYGTLKQSITQYEFKGTGWGECFHIIRYWDLEKRAFRSFSIWSLISE